MNINKSKHLLTIALTALIIVSTSAASIMSGCGNNPESTDETKVVTETQVVTKMVDATSAADSNKNSNSDNSSSKGDSSSNKTSSKSNSGNSESSGNSSGNSANSDKNNNSSHNLGNNSNSSNKNNGSSSSKVNSDKTSSSAQSSSSSKPSSSSSKPHKPVTDSNACTIDGEKFAKGDTVTCVYKLTTPEVLENYQATIKYDSKYLRVVNAELGDIAAGGGILNYQPAGEILFNGSNITRGYNFTNGGTFVTVVYEVKSSGSTKTSVEWIAATGKSGKTYVSGNKPVNGMKLTHSYS